MGVISKIMDSLRKKAQTPSEDSANQPPLPSGLVRSRDVLDPDFDPELGRIVRKNKVATP